MSGDTAGSALAIHAEGVTIALAVTPRAGTTGFDRVEAGAVRLRVAAPPVDGAANAAVLAFLADAFSLPRSRVRLLAGATGRRKRVLLVGLDVDQAAAALDRILAPKSYKAKPTKNRA